MKQEATFFKVLRCGITGERLSEKDLKLCTPEALAEWMTTARHFDLVHLLHHVFLENGLSVKAGETQMNALSRAQFLAVFRVEKLSHAKKVIASLFEREGIQFMPLKGSVIRRAYPEPWMRTSSDIDILLQKEDLERATQLIVREMHYTADELGPYQMALFSKENDVHAELHLPLFEKDCISSRAAHVLDDIFEKAIPRRAGSCELLMDDDFLYFYHVAYMARCFRMGGAGIRPFLDLFMLNRREGGNPQKRKALLEQGGLAVFAAEAEHLTDVWFGTGRHTKVSALMAEQILHGGLHGRANTDTSAKPCGFFQKIAAKFRGDSAAAKAREAEKTELLLKQLELI